MQTEKQAELIKTLVSYTHDDDRMLCESISKRLIELGYTPKKHKKSTFVVSFEKNGRLIAKMEIGGDPKCLTLFLRFSACEGYSQIFEDAVARRPESWVKRNQEYVSFKIEECCGNCKGKPRFYYFINDDGIKIDRCGGYTLPIPGVKSDNIPEIIELIEKQDEYLTNVLPS